MKITKTVEQGFETDVTVDVDPDDVLDEMSIAEHQGSHQQHHRHGVSIVRQKSKDMKEESLPILPRLREMKVGEKIDFPIKQLNSVKNSCSNIGLLYERKYKTTVCRKDQSVVVTRIK